MKFLSQHSLFVCTIFTLFFAEPLAAKEKSQPEAVPHQYVIKLKDIRSWNQDRNTVGFLKNLNMQLVQKLTQASRSLLVSDSKRRQPQEALKALKSHPQVEMAEPNFLYNTFQLPDDERLADLWGLINEEKNGVDIDAATAWQLQTGDRKVVVAVIDSGVNYQDEDLKNNSWVNLEEKEGLPEVDDDENGYVDDIYGYNFVNDTPDPMDDNRHGSHCAGTIGAEGNNGVGVVGVNWQVSLMALKFLSRTGGGSLANAIRAIDYATEKKVDVMNNSWGGGGYSELLAEAIERSQQAGVLFVAAAGNSRSNNDVRPMYPASYPIDNIISVAAINGRGELAGFSNFGKETVHVAAPGVDILSTSHNHRLIELSGTSMAAPHVAGVAALLRAQYPEMDYLEMKERILTTSIPNSQLSSRLAYGVLNAGHALLNIVPEPEPDHGNPADWPYQEQQISSPHPYANGMDESWTLTVPGAERVSVHFARFELERNYDFVHIYNGDGEFVSSLSGQQGQTYSPIVEGESMTLRLVSDESVVDYGFDVDRIHYQGDSVQSQLQ